MPFLALTIINAITSRSSVQTDDVVAAVRLCGHLAGRRDLDGSFCAQKQTVAIFLRFFLAMSSVLVDLLAARDLSARTPAPGSAA
jgi:hypothetical protein